MRQISAKLKDKNFNKVKDRQAKLQKNSKKTKSFSDALNDLLEKK